MKFLLTLLFVGVTLAVISLLWPRFSDQPRPVPLTQIRNTVVQTPLGAQAAMVLGVSDEASVQRFNLQTSVNDLTVSAAGVLQQRAQTVLTIHAVKQLQQQFQQLPQDQQEQIREVICK